MLKGDGRGRGHAREAVVGISDQPPEGEGGEMRKKLSKQTSGFVDSFLHAPAGRKNRRNRLKSVHEKKNTILWTDGG